VPSHHKIPPFSLEFYKDEVGNHPVLEWLRSLDATKRRSMGVALYEVLQHMGIDVCETEFGKNLGRGVFEFRVRQTASEILARRGHPKRSGRDPDKADILLRVYCHAYGEKVVLLVAAYDKGKDPSRKRENSEIALARRRLADFERGRKA
jgi:phage-related protein